MSSKIGRPPLDPVAHFWSQVEKTRNCWQWSGTPNCSGYGRLTVNGQRVLAHRFSWKIHGRGDLDGKELDHRCLNRLCVNPAHLRIVTRKQNNENKAGANRNNPVGIRGVTFSKRATNPYRGRVTHGGVRFDLGVFATVEEAEEAVVRKRLELFTHNEVDQISPLIKSEGRHHARCLPSVIPERNSS